MDQYRETAVYLKNHVKVLVNVFGITLFQRFALFTATWFVYKAFGLSGQSAWLIILLQSTISVSVDMLPLPGGMESAAVQLCYKSLERGCFFRESPIVANFTIGKGKR